MVVDLAFYRCFFCGQRFSADPETRQGHFIHGWKVAVCLRCLVWNPEGIPSEHPALKLLVAAGIPVKVDAEGHAPWP
jgi:hypothetical protein